jgi:hypothetical protein
MSVKPPGAMTVVGIGSGGSRNGVWVANWTTKRRMRREGGMWEGDMLLTTGAWRGVVHPTQKIFFL